MPTEKSYSQGTEFPPLQEGVLRIYSMRFCPFAQRTRLVLAHKKIPHETVNVHLRPATEKPDWFVKRNPLALVPVLEKDGKIVYESSVCNEYLDAVYPDLPLLPKDPYQKAMDDMLLARFGKATSNFFKFMTSKGSDTQAYDDCLEALKPFEEAIGKRGNFFGGKEVGMLDYNLWPFFERFVIPTHVFEKDLISKDKNPALHQWTERMMELPAVKACYFPPETHILFGMSQNKGSPDYDLGLTE